MTDNAKFFEKAAADVVKHVKELSDDKKLKLYGLYKQATIGDINIEKPGMLDFRGKAKWEAWNAVKGKDKEVAKTLSAYFKDVANVYKKKKTEAAPDIRQHLLEISAELAK